MSQLLFINKTQFGYHTDYYKYCQYLRHDFNITYLSFDIGYKKLEMEGVDIVYVPYWGPSFLRGFLFFMTCIYVLIKCKGVSIIHYFEYCEFLKKILPQKKMILDIRTLSVDNSIEKRNERNNKIKKATLVFDFITIASDELREKLNLDKNKSAVLPLGSDIISKTNKQFSEIKLLYVGTLSGRRILDTIRGLSLFLEDIQLDNTISYDIIGEGEELKKLKEEVSRLGLKDIVNFHGRIPHFELKPFFDKCNIGVSYIPVTEFYDNQPPTKTFEYILSGMVCIGTKTNANKKYINKKNGVLHTDSSKSFSKALKKVLKHKATWHSDIIRNSLREYTWENIIYTSLFPILKENIE